MQFGETSGEGIQAYGPDLLSAVRCKRKGRADEVVEFRSNSVSVKLPSSFLATFAQR